MEAINSLTKYQKQKQNTTTKKSRKQTQLVFGCGKFCISLLSMSLNSVMNFRTLNGSKLEREREREQEEGGWKRNLFNCKCYAIKAKNRKLCWRAWLYLAY
ncbi:uncharacterized protein LOC117564704 isoform X2 [Drosophila albomicans]|uniref:Uncharacterized protein LOC117564704 isoform X2 n=1 Tax=Drosophila albomicans TaxID=7291 RepID=A0A9C6WCH4_DROAB|nr:uncharacterized protein LOC117564704 isoform X2 [Drosophila albomicans]